MFNFKDNDKNTFPVIEIKNYFIIIGYDYYYDSEIINDIHRMNKGERLGKKLYKSRYLRRSNI